VLAVPPWPRLSHERRSGSENDVPSAKARFSEAMSNAAMTGKGAAELGLAGAVAPADLRAVLEGADPRTGQNLVGWRKRPGYDLTLSAPKSVSLLWGLGDRSTAAAVAAAHEEAVDAAVAYMEDAACVVRRGRGGRLWHPGVGLVGATSRAGDLNLHSDVVVANMTRGPDGEWSALFGQPLYRHARTAGFLYQAVLRHGLTTELGVGFGDANRGVREVEGIPASVRREFSRRRGHRAGHGPSTGPAPSTEPRSPPSTPARTNSPGSQRRHCAGAGRSRRRSWVSTSARYHFGPDRARRRCPTVSWGGF
jgi:conjugative relaxase-like TrwC/TraI family protein